ncbi:MAG: DUF2769 domain-containing protein [Euryarchaeota archaeon]|nr:DUF2769 domain-containing protein [Euryarchaeota archaeon]
MDIFERTLTELNALSGEKKQEELNSLKKECICPDCPTYTQCAADRGELLYCFLGKSAQCIEAQAGCICPDCVLTEKLGLKNIYYCTSGSEEEIR